MKITNLPNEYQKAAKVLRKIEEQDFEAYFVGGSVRDTLLKEPIHDVDIATSAFPAEIKALFPRTIDVGIEHGTVLVLEEDEQYEITTFRTESAYQDYRRPDKVEFVRTLEEDLKRRDFTINAFALKEDGEVIDLFNGLADLQDKILRAVGDPHERFHEDALRMMRGLRFVSQLGFLLEPATFEAISANRSLLEKISVERINVEFVKLLLGKHRNLALRLLVATGCYHYCPGLQGYDKQLLSFAELSNEQLTEEVACWVLLMDQLKLANDKIRPFLKAWKCSNETIKKSQAVYSSLQLRKKQQWTKMALYHSGEEVISMVENLLVYYHIPAKKEESIQRYQELPIHSLQELAVNGNDLISHLQKKAGKWLKEVLSVIEQAVIEEQLPNDKTAILLFAKKFLEEDNDEL